MNKIFIKYDKDNVVTYTHYKPFDSVYGLGKTEKELLKEGALVNEYNEPDYIEGKSVVTKYDKDNNNIYFEYVDAPQINNTNNVEILKEIENKISILESENTALKEELSQIQMSLASLLSETSKK
ncbi:MAG: hypothetical protein IJH55_00095 [Romboutsia sp.]|nr:hypothetical protein [Romboutsia sp.]